MKIVAMMACIFLSLSAGGQGLDANVTIGAALNQKEVLMIGGLVQLENGGYERPEFAEDVKITLRTTDGKKWKAVWIEIDDVAEKCVPSKRHAIGWAAPHKAGEVVHFEQPTLEINQNILWNAYIMAHDVKRGDIVKASDFTYRGNVKHLHAAEKIPDWLIHLMGVSCVN